MDNESDGLTKVRSKRMRAVICTRYGPPDVLQLTEMERPVPKGDEVLVKIFATTISPADIAFRKGKPFIGRIFTGLTKPKRGPGDVVAGRIEAVGKEARGFREGDRVFGSSGLKMGAQAEYICLSEEDALAPMPSNMDYGEAAAISYSGLTALPFLRDVGHVQSGQEVLVNGASGAIGTTAVQLAKYFGAEVTGVSSTANIELLRSLGADKVIDYTREDFTRSGRTYDLIFDAVGKSAYSRCKGSLKEGGIFLTTVPTLPILLRMVLPARSGKKRSKFAATGLRPPKEKIRDLAFLKEVAEKGRLRAVIDRKYPLEQIAEAHRYVDKGHRAGDVVMVVQS